MKLIYRLIITVFLLISSFYSVSAQEWCLELRDIDKWTFNEYCYKITQKIFQLQNYAEINGELSSKVLSDLKNLVNISYEYTPSDNLIYEKTKRDLITSLSKWTRLDPYLEEIIERTWKYLDTMMSKKIKWTIKASPSSGKAPLTVSLRASNIYDPSGSRIPQVNYKWWIDNGWKKVIIGTKPSMNYIFRDEWNYSVFLDIVSYHKNKNWNIDILPFRTRTDISVWEKIWTVILKVNDYDLRNRTSVKLLPDEARYWVLIDATSSTPAGWAKFSKTTWDFGNGVEKEYDWAPRVERVRYYGEGEYTVTLKIRTNEWRTLERKFIISVHNPIATIDTTKEEWYSGDKFTFKAKPSSIKETDLNYYWKIIDIDDDKVLYEKAWKVIIYTFKDKWKYNVQLKVTDNVGDQDIDTKNIFINSRPPVSSFSTRIEKKNFPNTVYFDWTKSYDLDLVDKGKLKYNWTIDGQKIYLDDSNIEWSTWYYTFDSVWNHTVTLEVTDPDWIVSNFSKEIKIDSILSLDFAAVPRVIQKDSQIHFIANSPNARFFEWNFGDGSSPVRGKDSKINHVFRKSWFYNIVLTVRDDIQERNSFTKVVYVWEWDSPIADIEVNSWKKIYDYDRYACAWKWAYKVSRIDTLNIDGRSSINIDWSTKGLKYTWKIWSDYYSSDNMKYKFDELWCFPIKLTVTSLKNGKSHSIETRVEVINLAPSFTSMSVNALDLNSDPVVVNVTANNAKDPDWIIQSYLWYYYTDTDPDPQDFRITSLPSTSFVIPKITWNYYFVVVMRDDNELRINSEDISSSRYFVTLAWDNVNTPLIEFKIADNSLKVWDEAVFEAKVKNIIWQDISSKSEYSWDFDGDWFYEKKTNSPNMTYIYEEAWTYYSKLKATYKWMSNVRNLQINVTNKLIPEFDYISIWNKFIFVDKSSWSYQKSDWDLWDSTKIDNKDIVFHEYKDAKNTHMVKLKISERTKTKTQFKKVKNSIKNRLYVKANSINVFSVPQFDRSSKEVTLKSKNDKLYVYLGKSSGNIKYYAIDNDIEFDSDLNGWEDDDRDNLKDISYETWEPYRVLLNDNRIQKLRAYILDENEELIDSYDIKIIKEYVKASHIDLAAITFNWVTLEEKAWIEKVKNFVLSLPQENRLQGMKYIQLLQESWFDSREKTQIILEFQSYLDSLWDPKAIDVIETLESFLVSETNDKSLVSMSYNVIKNLIPKELVEYNDIVSKLDTILETSWNLEEEVLNQNIKLWWEILSSIKDTSLMTNEDKFTVKAQLQFLIYNTEIPEKVVEEVVEEAEEVEKDKWIFAIIFWFLYIVLWVFWIFIFAVVLFYIWYLISNTNPDLEFQDFIIEKTSGWWSEPKKTPVSPKKQKLKKIL